MPEAKSQTKDQTFEEHLDRLETIVERLENGNIGLDESIKLYEEGVNLSKTCIKRLNEAEKKVVQLQKKLSDDSQNKEN